jgi:probable H4MPT-linked C1 transfer pathway protein
MTGIVGWDIGGVNVKASWLYMAQDRIHSRVVSIPFEIWRDKGRLGAVLQGALAALAPGASPRAMAVTMSAELSDAFETKREGVQFVLERMESSFPDVESSVLNVSGGFVPLREARHRPLEFAAANWVASAQWLARRCPDCLLIDAGSTTTDILPILSGKVCVDGRTDTARLISGELVYTGALRTNLAAVVQSVPVAGRFCRVASEYFTVSGDVNLILGLIGPEEYTCTTPDGRPVSIESARARLARLVCADTEMLSAGEIDELARYVHERQVFQIRCGLEQVLSRLPQLRRRPVIVIGSGAFLGREAAGGLDLDIRNLDAELGEKESVSLTCLAAAHLLAEKLKSEP